LAKGPHREFSSHHQRDGPVCFNRVDVTNGNGGSRSSISPVAMPTICLASWLGALGRLHSPVPFSVDFALTAAISASTTVLEPYGRSSVSADTSSTASESTGHQLGSDAHLVPLSSSHGLSPNAHLPLGPLIKTTEHFGHFTSMVAICAGGRKTATPGQALPYSN
jgi:hypothetical protein